MVSCWAILFVFGLAPWAGDFKFPGSGSCFVTLVKVACDMTQEAATTKHPLQCRVSFVFDRLAFSIPRFFKRPLMKLRSLLLLPAHKMWPLWFGVSRCDHYPPSRDYSSSPLKLHDNDMCSICSAAKKFGLGTT
jgi:hypothetical protein